MVILQLVLFIGVMSYAIAMIFRSIWMIPELRLNRALIFIHLLLFLALSVSFILDYVSIYSVMFLVNTIVLGALYMLLLYMIHKIMTPVSLRNLRVEVDEAEEENFAVLPQLKIPMFLLHSNKTAIGDLVEKYSNCTNDAERHVI